MDRSGGHQQGKLGHQWEAGTDCQRATHPPYSVVIWCNSMVNSQSQIMQLITQKHHKTLLLLHVPLLLLPQTQLLALFLPLCCHPQSCPLSS